MQEQRKFARYNTEGRVLLKLQHDPGRSIKSDLVDISLMGIGVYAQEKIEVGSEVNFIIAHKFWKKSILGTGRVKYAMELKKTDSTVFRTGIEFVNLAEKEPIVFIIDRINNIPASST